MSMIGPAEELPVEVSIPDADALPERLFAVHATASLPQGELIADLNPVNLTQRNLLREETLFFRPTNHFSLGGLCASHGRNSWEDKQYAVVLPLGALMETGQVVNINAHDTFTVGNVALTEEVTLVVPEDEPADDIAPDQIWRYDPQSSTIRQAIDEVIAARGGRPIDKPEGSVDLLDPAYSNGQNINTPEYFRDILQSNPNISFGSHAKSFEGTAQLFGLIDSHCILLRRPSQPINHTFSHVMAEHHLDQLAVQSTAYNLRAAEATTAAISELRDKLAARNDLELADITEEDAAHIDTAQWGAALAPLPPQEVAQITNCSNSLF